MSNQDLPSAEDIRTARHAGFDNSVDHIEDERRTRLTNAHRTQDERRENNITGFYLSVRGDEK